MADGKWIPGLKIDTPVVDAAHKVLSARLKIIQHYLPRAAEKPEEDIENVHQLRVGTRRARAALDIFADCLPGKVRKHTKRQFKKIRHAAGDARDWDVFQEMLRTWSAKRPAGEQPGLGFLSGMAYEQRRLAQDELIAADKKIDRAEILSALRPLDKKRPRCFGEMALPVLETALTDVNEAIAGHAAGYEYLHRIRILGKRLRYAMEVFADCFASPFRESIYPLVEEMQEILGAANDSHVAAQRIEKLRDDMKRSAPADWRRAKLGIEHLLQMHRRRMPEARKKFTAWRNRWNKVEPRLADLLLAPALPAAK